MSADLLTAAANPRAVMGGNCPPPSDREDALQRVEDLYDEARLWMDGKPVDSHELADGIGNLLNMIRSAEKRADDLRKYEKAPHLKAAKEIDDAYKSALDKAKQATAACKAALVPWLAKLVAEKNAAAEKSRQEADAKAQAARDAIRASDSANLDERATAEALLKDAKRAERAADRAGNDTAKAGSLGRAVSLRTTYVPVMVSAGDALKHYKSAAPDEIKALLQSLAERDVRSGKRSIPGFDITAEQKVV